MANGALKMRKTIQNNMWRGHYNGVVITMAWSLQWRGHYNGVVI